MSRFYGEAKLDTISGKWYYIIQSNDGQISEKSDAVFSSQAKAEAEMVESLKGFKRLADEHNRRSYFVMSFAVFCELQLTSRSRRSLRSREQSKPALLRIIAPIPPAP